MGSHLLTQAGMLSQANIVDHPFGDALVAVAVGFVIAGAARLLVPKVRSISWSTSALLAVLAGSGALALANLFDRDPTVLAMVLALALTILLLLAAAVVEGRMHPAVEVHSAPTAELLRLGESATVEFKSTGRRNLHTMERDPEIELAVAKTVCGLLNGRGGSLVVGVDDDGVPLGLDADLDLMKRPDSDAYELFLRDLLTSCLGVPAAAGVGVRFDDVEGKEVCRIDVAPSPTAVFLTPPRRKGKGLVDPEFWVRAGNGTRRLRIDELLEYHQRRWGSWRSRVFL